MNAKPAVAAAGFALSCDRPPRQPGSQAAADVSGNPQPERATRCRWARNATLEKVHWLVLGVAAERGIEKGARSGSTAR